MKFSILIPVFNIKEYVSSCLESAVRQDYNDYEIVIVNDGSTDGSEYICERYVSNYPKKITLVNQENKGLLMARRTAFSKAQGEYCICLDGDDCLRHDALRRIADAIEKSAADIVCFQMSRLPDFSDSFLDYSDFSLGFYSRDDGSWKAIEKSLTGSHSFNQMCSKAIRVTCIDRENDYSMYEGLQYGEDLMQVVAIVNRACSAAFLNESLYYYRPNMSSISHVVNPSRYADIKVVRTKLRSYAEQWDKSYLPDVSAMDCVEVLSYAIRVVLSKHGDLRRELQDVSNDPFFRKALIDADLSRVKSWKRLGIALLNKRNIKLFQTYIGLLFTVTKHCFPDKVINYI